MSRMIAEVWNHTGPTGRHVLVTEVSIRDYGDNQLGSARTSRGLGRRLGQFRVPVRTTPTRWNGPVTPKLGDESVGIVLESEL